tara:strand:- start:230 stop:634 length:405 start_codon:yes stop_codon:yes gene_type:complete
MWHLGTDSKTATFMAAVAAKRGSVPIPIYTKNTTALRAYAAFAMTIAPNEQSARERSKARVRRRVFASPVERDTADTSCCTHASRSTPPTGVPTIPENARVPENASDAAVVSSHRPRPTAMAGPKVENPMTAPL